MPETVNIILAALCIAELIFIAQLLIFIRNMRELQKATEAVRMDCMDRLMESDIYKLKRAQAIAAKAENTEVVEGEDIDEDDSREAFNMGARL